MRQGGEWSACRAVPVGLMCRGNAPTGTSLPQALLHLLSSCQL